MRDVLASRTSVSNVSLAIDCYTAVEVGGDKALQKEMLRRLAAVKPSSVYEIRYGKWREAVESLPDMLVLDFQLASPMAVGLGNETVFENGLSFNRIYGMPAIPGSSLKGVLRRAAAELMGIEINDKQWDPGDDDEAARSKMGEGWTENMDTWRALFGSPDGMAGLVVFDAWLKPDLERSPFRVDVLTPHHGDYYAGKQPLPLDSDQPIPVSFLSVRPETVFTFAIQLPNEEWREPMRRVLVHALSMLGVGAKTNSGYGFFRKRHVEPKEPAKPKAAPAPVVVEQIADGTHEVEVTLLSKVRSSKANATWKGLTFSVEKFRATDTFPQRTSVIAKVVIQGGRVARATFVRLA